MQNAEPQAVTQPSPRPTVLIQWAWRGVWKWLFPKHLLPWGYSAHWCSWPTALGREFIWSRQVCNKCPGVPLDSPKWMNEQMSSFLLKGLRWGGVSHKTLTGEKKPRQRQAIQMWHQLLAQKKQARVWIEDTCFKPQKLDISTLARLADHVVLIMLLTLNVFAWPYQAL